MRQTTVRELAIFSFSEKADLSSLTAGLREFFEHKPLDLLVCGNFGEDSTQAEELRIGLRTQNKIYRSDLLNVGSLKSEDKDDLLQDVRNHIEGLKHGIVRMLIISPAVLVNFLTENLHEHGAMDRSIPNGWAVGISRTGGKTYIY